MHAIGFTGDDGEAFDLRKELARLNCQTEHLHIVPDRHTPTYLKPREAHLASLQAEHPRYDTKNRLRTTAQMEESIIRSLRELVDRVDAVIILDQVEEADCGAVTKRVRKAISQLAQQIPRVVFWADSRRRIRAFSQVIIKPNQFEAVGKSDPRPGEEVQSDELARPPRRCASRPVLPSS